MKFGSLIAPVARRAGVVAFGLSFGLSVLGLGQAPPAEARASPATEGDGPTFASAALPRAAKAKTAESTAEAGEAPSAADPAERRWQLVRGRHWQIAGPAGEAPEITDLREDNRGSCPPGMVEIAGKMKQHARLDELQLQACTAWIDKKWPERCAAYDREKWLALSKDLPTRELRYCIDRYEYPNRHGEYPIIVVSFFEARDACEAEGKRLCSEDEWTFACEGEEATPYPNGYVRDPEACLNDRPWRPFKNGALKRRSDERARRELDRLWQGLPSGARPLCKSSFGVYDMTGNIDEWTRSSVAGERPSVLKGGYWGPVRTRCRPATKAHDEHHVFYQQGFRCCADAP